MLFQNSFNFLVLTLPWTKTISTKKTLSYTQVNDQLCGVTIAIQLYIRSKTIQLDKCLRFHFCKTNEIFWQLVIFLYLDNIVNCIKWLTQIEINFTKRKCEWFLQIDQFSHWENFSKRQPSIAFIMSDSKEYPVCNFYIDAISIVSFVVLFEYHKK